MYLLKEQFYHDPLVREFVHWLSDKTQNIEVKLKIKRSNYVRVEIAEKCHGLDEVLSHYCWKSSWLHPFLNQVEYSENWQQTKNSLKNLSLLLKKVVEEENENDILLVCKAILKWGGDRNSKQGATPQLAKLYSTESLGQYLRNVRTQIDANFFDTKNIRSSVIYSGSMWTKIYALFSNTGAPIYDTRVSAAIAGLVSLFLKEKNLARQKVHLLDFSVPHRQERRSHIIFPNLEKTKFSSLSNNSSRWTEDTMKLSWLMDAVLAVNGSLFPKEVGIIAKKHAFEASLFMIGYDIRRVIT